MDAVRHLARNWERWGDSVDGILGELQERRSETARLADELRESRTDQAQTRRELDAKAEALKRLETAYAALAQERQALHSALGELQERHDALLQDRRFAIEHLEAALERLRS
jgi:chromosome segregation ATPase